jgi:hypothetical protein
MRALALVVTVALATAVGGCDSQSIWSSISSFWQKKQPAGPVVVTNNSFKGSVQAEWMAPPKQADYFRDMRLLSSFGYVDQSGKHWDVPAGYVTNGASVPWGLWNIVGGPYDGPYRDAAVIHDYFCEAKTRPWEEVHKMFYEAALARGTSESLASTMYAALRFGGPRWEVVAQPASGTSSTPSAEKKTGPDASVLASSAQTRRVDPGLTRGAPSQSQQQQFQDLQKWIETAKPNIAEIERRVEQLRQQNGMSTAPTR